MFRVVLAATTLFGLASAGCGKHLHGREDLDVAVFSHHVDLRWGRLDNAALHLLPELRPAFVQAWTERQREVELQDIDVTGVAVAPDGNSAQVALVVIFVERSSMSVRTAQLEETWIRTPQGWRLEKPATL